MKEAIYSFKQRIDMLILFPLMEMKILIKPLSLIDDMFGDVDYIIFNTNLNDII